MSLFIIYSLTLEIKIKGLADIAFLKEFISVAY